MKCQDCNERANKIMALRKERDTLRAERDGLQECLEITEAQLRHSEALTRAAEAELADALARVGELVSELEGIKNTWLVKHRLEGIEGRIERALALPVLGATSRLRDKIYEECEAAALKVRDRHIFHGRHSRADACDEIIDAIRARKSKEADHQGLDYNRGVRWAYEALRAARYRKSKEADR